MNKKLFFIHHSNEQDLKVLRAICKALHPLVQQKGITIWSTEDIPAGANIQAETNNAFAEADWVLPLVSADYLSDTGYKPILQKNNRMFKLEHSVLGFSGCHFI